MNSDHSLTAVAAATVANVLAGLGAQSPGFWEPRSDLNVARQEVGAATLHGMVYVAGGLDIHRRSLASVERYDPKVGRWLFVANMPTTLHHFGMAPAGGKLYAVGGYISGFTATDRCSTYDPATDRWTAIASLPRARGGFVAVAIGGKIYAAGGVVLGGGVVGDLTVYDPATDRWSTRAPMPTAREHLAAAAIGDKLYVAGGRTRRGNLRVVEEYDTKTDRWRRLPDMPTARGGNGAAVLAGKLIVVGGEFPGIFRQTEEYDPVANRWRSLELMRPGLHGIYPVILGDEMMVPGGAVSAGFAAVKTVISLRMLPDGVDVFGAGSPACMGALETHVTHRPVPNESQFAMVCQHAPPQTVGFLALGIGADVPGSTVLGFRSHLDLKQPVLLVPVRTDAAGVSSQRLPLPGNSTGLTGYGQFVFANTAACGGAGTVSSSPGTKIRIR